MVLLVALPAAALERASRDRSAWCRSCPRRTLRRAARASSLAAAVSILVKTVLAERASLLTVFRLSKLRQLVSTCQNDRGAWSPFEFLGGVGPEARAPCIAQSALALSARAWLLVAGLLTLLPAAAVPAVAAVGLAVPVSAGG